MTDVHLRKLEADLLQYIETYGRENKILKKNRSVNITKTIETMLREHRTFTEKRLWESVRGTQTNPSSIEKSLKSRKFATLLDPETLIIACAKDFAKKGKIHKVQLSFCDNCFQRNPQCPCKQDSPTQNVYKPPIPTRSVRHNGGDPPVSDSTIVSNEIACPMLDGEKIHPIKCEICKVKAWNTWRACKEGRLKISK